GGAAVSAVRAAVAASVTIAGGAHRRTTSVDWAVVHRFAMPCPGCQGGIRVETNTENGGMVPVLRPVLNQRFNVWFTCTALMQVVSSLAAIAAGGVAGHGRVRPQSGQVQCSHRLRENRGRL